MVTSYCALCRKDSLYALVRWFCVSRKGATGGGSWGHLRSDMHMVAVMACCQRAKHIAGLQRTISVQALTPKLNPSPLPALISKLVTLTMPTH